MFDGVEKVKEHTFNPTWLKGALGLSKNWMLFDFWPIQSQTAKKLHEHTRSLLLPAWMQITGRQLADRDDRSNRWVI